MSRADCCAPGRQLRVFAEPAHDVLDVDDRVVDELANRNRQSTEAHAVERQAEPIERDHRREQRQRQREQRDRRGSEVHQKHDDDQDDQAGTLDERPEKVVQ